MANPANAQSLSMSAHSMWARCGRKLVKWWRQSGGWSGLVLSPGDEIENGWRSVNSWKTLAYNSFALEMTRALVELEFF